MIDKQKKDKPEIRYVPYENYVSRILAAFHERLGLIERHLDVIKERITFDYKDVKKKNNG